MSQYTKSRITRMGSHNWDYWKAVPKTTNGIDGFEIHWSDDGECVTDHVYTKADAYLMAAAPLMFETLKHLHSFEEFGLQNNPHIKKVIDAATGMIE